MVYRGRLDNISIRGAMVSADECIMIPHGETCTLFLYPTEGAPPIVITAQVRHSFFSMVGVLFVSFADDAEIRLYELMQKITGKPEALRREWNFILGHGEEQKAAACINSFASKVAD